METGKEKKRELDGFELQVQAISKESWGAPRAKTLEAFLNPSHALMNSPSIERQRATRQKFVDLLEIPEFHLMTREEQGLELGVSAPVVTKWFAQVPDSALEEALKKCRERRANTSLKVDAALIRKAVDGDVKAIELYYRKDEGWTPAQGIELTRGRDKEAREASTVELVKGLLGTLSPEQKAELLKAGETEQSDPGHLESVE
jgi:hypothetical protein